MPLPRLLRDLLTVPTASFREEAVLDIIRQRCAKLAHVKLSSDKYGNIVARYRHNPPKTTPLVFAAHTDHPSFVALKMIDNKHVRAEFRGGVHDEYFVGSKVRFYTEDGLVRGKIVDLNAKPKPRGKQLVGSPKTADIKVPREIATDTIGMWDLPDPELKDGLIHARGCDDITGVAGIMALLERLARKEAAADVYALFTRAEEVGFVGAIGASKLGTLSRKLPIIAIENSSALAGAEIGGGPVLRVGDKASVFTPELTQFCNRVADDLALRRKTFAYQRKLMDGGTCESTAYIAYGYAATGICLALGNYHNMDIKRKKIAPEYISIKDWEQMVSWFEALVMDKQGFGHEQGNLRDRLEQRFGHYLERLS
jgi:putative aminopeptidase FrvX